MPGSSSWMPYAPQGVKEFDDDVKKLFAWVLLTPDVGVWGTVTLVARLYGSVT